MADSSVRNILQVTTSDRAADLLYIVDVSQAVGSGDRTITPQKLMDDAPASGTQAGSMSSVDFTKLAGLSNYTNEQAQDAVGTILTDSSSINFTYDDVANTITAVAIFGTTAGTVCEGNDARLSNARTPTAHTHPSTDITDFAEAAQDAVGGILTDSTSIDFTYNDVSNTISASAIFGTGAGTVAQGNDSRFTDARTPTSHAASHKSGGSDVIRLDELAAPTDITTLNATSTAHGLLPKLSNVATEFLNGTGAWSTPTGGGATLPTTTKGDLIVHDGSTNVRLPVGANGKALVSSSSASSGLAYMRAPYLHYHENSTINVNVSAATDSDIWTYTLPANTLGANGILHIVALVKSVTTATAGTRTGWKFKFGGSVYRQSQTQVASNSQTYPLELYIMNRGATNSQVGWTAGALNNSWTSQSPAAATSSVDTTAGVILSLTYSGIAAANDACTINFVLVNVTPGF